MISAVIVHYRTPRRLEAAVAALREDARSIGAGTRNRRRGQRRRGRSRRPANAEDAAPEDLPARVLRPPGNLGYAAGINLGVEHATGDVLLLMNADVAVEAGCLRALLDVLGAGGVAEFRRRRCGVPAARIQPALRRVPAAALRSSGSGAAGSAAGGGTAAEIAGPRLFWDEGCRLMLPPQQLRTRRAELDAALAERWPAWGRRFRRRWRRRARAFWRADEPVTCYELTGACLAVTRDGWRRVGRFDERFRLYFEETEWLLRARRAGVRAVLAPAARCVHAYDQSAQREPRARLWFEESAARFRRRRYGAWFAALLRLLERVPRRFEEAPELAAAPPVGTEGGAASPAGGEGGSADGGEGGAGRGGETWVEVTTLPLGVPAAGCRVAAGEAADFEIPPDVRAGTGSNLWIRVTP